MRDMVAQLFKGRNATYWENQYLVDSVMCFVNIHLLDGNLSVG